MYFVFSYMSSVLLYTSGSQPGGGGEFPPRGEFSIFQGGNLSLPRFKKNYAQYETVTILELMVCREPYRTN